MLTVIGGALEPHRFPGGTFIEPGTIYPAWWRVGMLVGSLVSVAALVLWAYYTRASVPAANADGSVVVSDDELVLVVDGAPESFDRSSIVNVFVDENTVGVTLDDGRTLALWTQDVAVRRALRLALAPDPATSRAVIPVGGAARAFAPVSMLAWWLLVVLFPLLVSTAGVVADELTRGSVSALPYFAAMVAAFAAIWSGLRRREVMVGTDGVRLRGTFFDTFVAHDAIERVVHFSDDRVVIHHAGGKKLRLPPAPASGALKERIEAARKLPREVAPAVAGLARGDRSDEDWHQALTALAEDRSYRAGALRIEDVEATLADPGARPDARVGAAIALRDRAEGRARIRVAAETTADADLQAALEAAAEGEVAGRALGKAQRRFDARKKR